MGPSENAENAKKKNNLYFYLKHHLKKFATTFEPRKSLCVTSDKKIHFFFAKHPRPITYPNFDVWLSLERSEIAFKHSKKSSLKNMLFFSESKILKNMFFFSNSILLAFFK